MSRRWVTDYIDVGEFTNLFIEELGWQRPLRRNQNIQIHFENEIFTLTEVAQYKGVTIWECQEIPSNLIQRHIDKELRKESTERVIIFQRWTIVCISSNCITKSSVTSQVSN